MQIFRDIVAHVGGPSSGSYKDSDSGYSYDEPESSSSGESSGGLFSWLRGETVDVEVDPSYVCGGREYHLKDKDGNSYSTGSVSASEADDNKIHKITSRGGKIPKTLWDRVKKDW